MKSSSGTTTQVEINPATVLRGHFASDSRSTSTPRASSFQQGETLANLNPPIYNSPEGPQFENEENHDEEGGPLMAVHSTGIYEAETGIVTNRPYSQIPPPPLQNLTLSLEEPACALIPNRPAVWVVKANRLKLSTLAASVLLDNGILSSRDIALLYASYSPMVDQGPPDPVSGVLTATHRTILGILGGLADYPVAISRIATTDGAASKREAALFALDSRQGISRIVGSTLKAPMEYTLGLSQGFNNVPKMWGDTTVRTIEPVTGVRSGLKIAGKSFTLGLYDGVTGLVTQPVKGAQKGGVGGCVGGIFKGLAGVACKPAAGVAGISAYTFKGFYEEYQKKRGLNMKSANTAALMQQGWEELGSSTVEERNQVLTKWYHLQSLKGQNG